MTKKSQLRILYIGNQLSVHGSTPTNIETLGPQLEKEGYKLYYASSKRNQLLRFADMLGCILKSSRKADTVLIDTYSTNAFYFAWATSQLCRLLRVPYIPVLHGGNLPQRIETSPVLTRQIFKNSFTNVVVSGYLQDCLNKKGYKSELIPNNIDLEIYPFRYREHIKPRLLWVRAFHKTYNPQLAIKVVAGLSKKYPDITLTMVGPEKDGSQALCIALANELGVHDKISFTGKLSKPDWISLSKDFDIFINTTDFDNLPVSVIEAMALGFPIVTTRVGGIPFLLEQEKTGLMVEPQNTDAMISAIDRLIQDSDLTSSLSMQARHTVEKFDWPVVKEKWHTLFRSLN